jgi:hypothetical protein
VFGIKISVAEKKKQENSSRDHKLDLGLGRIFSIFDLEFLDCKLTDLGINAKLEDAVFHFRPDLNLVL